ncbi:MAG: hypothetical protein JXA44_00165 [Methanospirillaceae archaeon]|nr:hypothetical protein [Methanospirillaceae archaeon]
MEKRATDIYELMWGPSECTITGTLRTYERAEDLGGISVPTLFTGGRYDEASPESVLYYQSMLPGSRLEIFEEASHTHHLEQMIAYNQVVRDFLHSVE